jgi:hypothetical protein
MTRALCWPPVILASASGAAFAMAGHVGPPLQPLIAFWFLLVCPGMAFVPLLRLPGGLTALTLALALSIALDTLVAETMVLTRTWSPAGALGVLIGISMVGAVCQLIAARRAGRRRRAL